MGHAAHAPRDPAREARLYRRFPWLQKLVRAGVYGGRELLVLGFVKRPG